MININAMKRDLEDVGSTISIVDALELCSNYHKMWTLRIRSILAECLYACVVRTVRPFLFISRLISIV